MTRARLPIAIIMIQSKDQEYEGKSDADEGDSELPVGRRDVEGGYSKHRLR